MPLEIDQLLLRGSSLRNTNYVYGLAIYTGHDTKVMMNSTTSRTKFSKVELKSNEYIILSIFIQIAVCLSSATYTSVW